MSVEVGHCWLTQTELQALRMKQFQAKPAALHCGPAEVMRQRMAAWEVTGDAALQIEQGQPVRETSG